MSSPRRPMGVLLLFTIAAHAQIAGTGTIRGTVTDPSGAVVPGAVVTVTNLATGVETRREATSAGLYVIQPLPAGVYKLSVNAPGFRSLVQDNVTVDALSNVEINARMRTLSCVAVDISRSPGIACACRTRSC